MTVIFAELINNVLYCWQPSHIVSPVPVSRITLRANGTILSPYKGAERVFGTALCSVISHGTNDDGRQVYSIYLY